MGKYVHLSKKNTVISMGIYIVKGHLPFVVDLKRWVETNPKKNLRLAMRECQFKAVDFFQSVEANEAIPNIPK